MKSNTYLFKSFAVILFSCIAETSYSQAAGNVGIGTNTPQAKLEVKNPVMSAIKIRSNNYSDSTRLILSNRDITEAGTDFIISSNQETGLNISSSSDLLFNTRPSIMLLSPQGNVGINNTNPANKLDVNGDVNFTGVLKVNGSAGNAGEFLRSNGGGSMNWASNGFQNQVVYSVTAFPGTAGDYIWTVPAGITKIRVELWSAGGHGGFSQESDSVIFNDFFYTTGGGGGGGGYASALLTVSPGQALAIHVPQGGEGGYASVTNGANAIYMNNGNDGNNASGSGGLGGNFGGSTGTFTNILWMKGENGAYYNETHDIYSYSSQTLKHNNANYGNGGSSANSATGGNGGIRYETIVESGPSTPIRRFVVRKGANGGFPGGGGGGGISPGDPSPSGNYSYPLRGLGAGGMIVIHF